MLKHRADFVVILAPCATILRPVSQPARAFLEAFYGDWPRGIVQSLIFDNTGDYDAFNTVLDRLSAQHLTVEVL